MAQVHFAGMPTSCQTGRRGQPGEWSAAMAWQTPAAVRRLLADVNEATAICNYIIVLLETGR
jgi:hypothetical protein